MTKINLGCGPHAIEGWINYDIDSHAGVTKLDLSLGRIPHADNSVDFMFSEHFFEHLTRSQAVNLLKECYRTMKPGAVIRITMPDLSRIMSRFLDWELKDKKSGLPGCWEPDSASEFVNSGLTMWGHRFVWSAKDFINQLEAIGFAAVKCRSHWYSPHTELCKLEVREEFVEMYIEATKP